MSRQSDSRGPRCLSLGLALSLALGLAVACMTPMRAGADDELFEEHHAHEHGVATLEVAIEGSQLALLFRSPAVNLLGFEHRPRSAQDQAALSRAMTLLRDPVALFQPSTQARCYVRKANVVPPKWEHSEVHSEFTAEYAFQCERPAELEHLQVKLLQHLDEHVKVDVQLATPAEQRREQLTRSNSRLSLRSRRE